MSQDTIVKNLDLLSECQSALDVIRMNKQILVDQVITPEIKNKLREIDEEFNEPVRIALENMERLEADIREQVIDLQTSVKGKYLHAIFSKPRVSWDNKALDGYAIAHPEILAARKVGDPSVSIRKV